MRRSATCIAVREGSSSQERKTSESPRSRALPAAGPSSVLARGGATETVEDGSTGVLVDVAIPEAFAEAVNRALTLPFDSDHIRSQALRFSRHRFHDEMRRCIEDAVKLPRGRRVMVSRQKRLLVVYYVIFDGLLGMLAFALAYAVRFETGLIDAPQRAAAL